MAHAFASLFNNSIFIYFFFYHLKLTNVNNFVLNISVYFSQLVVFCFSVNSLKLLKFPEVCHCVTIPLTLRYNQFFFSSFRLARQNYLSYYINILITLSPLVQNVRMAQFHDDVLGSCSMLSFLAHTVPTGRFLTP